MGVSLILLGGLVLLGVLAAVAVFVFGRSGE